MIQTHSLIHGKVQGVWFRAWTRKLARKLELTGWVRNTPDGSVEVVAQGDAESIYRFHKKLHGGPPLARVLRIDHEEQPMEATLPTFDIRT